MPAEQVGELPLPAPLLAETDQTPGLAVKRPGSRAKKSAWSESLWTFFRVIWANPLTFIGFLMVVIIAATALIIVAVPVLSYLILGHVVSVLPYPPNATSADSGQPPSLNHLFGTNQFGQDMFSQVMAALPLDLTFGVTISASALAIGATLGLVAGYWDKPGTVGGFVSVLILRVTDIFLAFPSLILALAIAATLGRSTFSAFIAITITWWPYYVRLTRGEVLAVKTQPYITAAKSSGVTDGRILVRHVLRNILEPLLVYYTMDIGTILIVFSTIAFFGLSVPVQVPEWGNIINNNLDYLPTLPWTVLFAGAAIFITVLAFSLLGDGLRDVLDPRSRRVMARSAATVAGTSGPAGTARPEGSTA